MSAVLIPAVLALFYMLRRRYSTHYLGTLRCATLALSSPLRRCSSLYYPMTLQSETAALSPGLRRRSPLLCGCAIRALPELSCKLPGTLNFPALTLTSALCPCSPPYSANDHLCHSPGPSSALCRR